MRLSWILVLLLLVGVAVFSVQNAEPIAVRFLVWERTISAALVIQLAALVGALTGLAIGSMSQRARHRAKAEAPPPPEPPPEETRSPAGPLP